MGLGEEGERKGSHGEGLHLARLKAGAAPCCCPAGE